MSDQYRDLFERSADAHLIIEGGRFVDCNQATVEILRYRNKQELLQTHPSQLSPEYQPDGRPSFEKANEIMDLASKVGSHRFEWEHKRADGEIFPVEVLLTAVPGENGPRLHTVWRDITERKRLESELRQAQKMEAVGKLAGGVAHDFNNLLVAILGHSEMLESALGPGSDLLVHATEVRRAGERAADLVGRLLAFSRKQVLAPQVIDIVPLLTNLSTMLQRLIGEGIRLDTRLPSSPLCVLADPGQLEQAVVNLVTNARDAISESGTVTLSAEHHLLPAPTAGSRLELSAGDYVMITVADTGAGIAPEVIERIFDPFFTTKGRGAGTGLGLASVYGVIKQSGGDIEVTSEAGLGTWFRFYLPLSLESPHPVEHPTASPKSAGGQETILMVEDDEAAATLMAKVLRRNGYTVITAGDGQAALDLVTSGKARGMDMVLTDVVMPRMGGLELARRLRERLPDLPVLLTSGYAEEVVFGTPGEADAHDLLTKPFTPGELCSRVRRILDDRNG